MEAEFIGYTAATDAVVLLKIVYLPGTTWATPFSQSAFLILGRIVLWSFGIS